MKLVVIGDGGHSKVVRDLIGLNKGCTIKAILDDRYEEPIMDNGVYKGPISLAPGLLRAMGPLKFVIAIGNNEVRRSIVIKLDLTPDHYMTLIHPTAVISPSATIGEGTVVMAHTIINADTQVGHHVIVNSGAIVEHDNCLADYVHVAPRATLTGFVSVQEGTMIGAGATIIPGKHIGGWTLIGAGATVIHDIPANCTAAGIPARLIAERM